MPLTKEQKIELDKTVQEMYESGTVEDVIKTPIPDELEKAVYIANKAMKKVRGNFPTLDMDSTYELQLYCMLYEKAKEILDENKE